MLLASSLVGVSPAAAQVKTPPPDGTPLALVLFVDGAVTRGADPVTGGSMLAEGETVALADGASIRMSLITSCHELLALGPGKMSLTEGALTLDGAQVADSQPSPGCVNAERVTLSTASQLNSGAVVVRGAGDRGRLAPRSGTITADRRRLVWDGPLADGRDVLVTLIRGEIPDEVLIERETKGGVFELPASLPLLPGAEYAWSVEPAGLAPGPSLAGSFQVASAAIASQLATLRERATDTEGWLRVAFFCEVHLLQTDAAEAYANVLIRDPGATGAQLRLQELDLP
jgi:hypothetical protein